MSGAEDPSSRLVTWKIVVGALVTGVAGISMMVAANILDKELPGWLKVSTENIGSMLATSAALAVIWDLFVRRDFMHEILMKTRIASDVDEAGLESISLDYLAYGWPRLITESKSIDVFLAYGNTWRNNNREHLKAFLAKKGARMRVFLPDYRDQRLLGDLARRFGKSEQDVAQLIQGAAQEFLAIGAEQPVRKRIAERSTLEVFLAKKASPLVTIYICGSMAVVTLYSNTPGRGQVPMLTFREGGKHYNYYRAEMDRIAQDSEKIVPPAA